MKRNSINVHCKFGSHQKWELAGRIGDFGNFLNGFAKSPQLIVLNIDWVQYLSCKIVKYCILCEVCIINSSVSSQMWCIKSIKGWFTHPRVCWQDFVKYKLVESKNFALICFPRICFPGLIYCDQEPLWFLNVIEDDCCFLGVLYGYQLDVRCFTLKSLSLSLKSHMNLPLS